MAVGKLTNVGQNLYRSEAGTYYSLFKKGGKQFRQSLRTMDPALAKRRLREQQEKASRVSRGSVTSKLRFEELADGWLKAQANEVKESTLQRRRTAINGLNLVFGALPVRSISEIHMETWKERRGSTLSPRSWNIEVETLSLILRYARDNLRIIIDNPAESLKRRKQPKNRITIPSKDEFRRLLDDLRSGHRSTGDAADLVEFLAYSGCRVAEAAGLRWLDVNFENNSLTITGGDTGTKNHEARVIPLFEPTRRLLTGMKERLPSSAANDRVFAIRSARLQIHRACERLQFPRFGHHTMRHFFCSNAIEAGCDFKVIAGWLGHKDGGVLAAQTYGHLRNEHSEAMAKRITFDAQLK